MNSQKNSGNGGGDVITYGSVIVILIGVFLLAVAMAVSLSPEMSLKEFLDKNLGDSLNGDLRDYSPGDQINITDTIYKISTEGEYTYISLVSTKGTEYEDWLSLQGDLSRVYSEGDKISFTLRIGLSDDGEREVFLPLTQDDITILKEGGA